MLCYPELAQDSKGIHMKNFGFSVGELGAYAEPTKKKASTTLKMTENRWVKENGHVL